MEDWLDCVSRFHGDLKQHACAGAAAASGLSVLSSLVFALSAGQIETPSEGFLMPFYTLIASFLIAAKLTLKIIQRIAGLLTLPFLHMNPFMRNLHCKLTQIIQILIL